MTASIRQHLQNLWYGHYSTKWAIVFLILGIFILPVVLLLLFTVIGYIIKVSTGFDVLGEPLGVAVWFPVVAYMIVSATGVWRSGNNQVAKSHAAGIKQPVMPILAKLLAVLCFVAAPILGLFSVLALIDEFGGETFQWVRRHVEVADTRERGHSAAVNPGDDEIKTLREYLQYLSGRDFGESKLKRKLAKDSRSRGRDADLINLYLHGADVMVEQFKSGVISQAVARQRLAVLHYCLKAVVDSKPSGLGAIGHVLSATAAGMEGRPGPQLPPRRDATHCLR